MASSPTTFDGAFSRHHAAVEAMRKRVEPLGDGSLASEESPATTRRRLLAGRVIRQLPLPPASATLEPAEPALEDEASMPSTSRVRCSKFTSPSCPPPANRPAALPHARRRRREPHGSSATTSSPAPVKAPQQRQPFYPHDMLPLDAFNPEEPPGPARALLHKRGRQYNAVHCWLRRLRIYTRLNGTATIAKPRRRRR